VGSNQTITVEYSLGGHPTVLVPSESMTGSGLCGYSANVSTSVQGGSTDNSGASKVMYKCSSAIIVFFALFFGLVTMSL